MTVNIVSETSLVAMEARAQKIIRIPVDERYAMRSLGRFYEGKKNIKQILAAVADYSH